MKQPYQSRSEVLLNLALSGMLVLISGCGDFFAQKPTEVQSREILEELSEVRESPNLENKLPDVYRQPTTRLAIKGGVKVFYFTKHHPAADLANLVQQQLDVQSTINLATNQIVAYCKDDAQADAVQQYLELVDVSPIQVNVDCLILERFGDITMDWETTLLVQDLLTQERMDNVGLSNVIGEERLEDQLTLGELKYPNPVFPGASLRESERSNFGLDFGYWVDQGVDGEQIRSVVDVLVSRGYLKILLNPQLETINGKSASVTIKDYAPIEEVKTGSAGASGVYNITKYVWVENTLMVTPCVYSDGMVGLKTSINIGSRSKPEGVVQRSIITQRSIEVDENRIAPGKSLIIGGMRKSEKRSVIRGIPFLKDLPLLGILFSSKDFEEKGTEIIFILTPSISSGGIENAQMVSDVRKKYAEPEYEKKLTDVVTEPFNEDAYTRIVEGKAADAELNRVQAEVELEQAQQQAQAERKRADQAEAHAATLRQEAADLQKQVHQAQAEAKAAAKRAHGMQTQVQDKQNKVVELEVQHQQIAAEAEACMQEAVRANQEAVEANQRARQARQQLQRAQEKLEKAKETNSQTSTDKTP